MKDDRQDNLDKLQLSLYLMPFVGAIWAGIRLANKSSNNLDSQEIKTSRLSVRVTLIWLIIYSSLSLGGNLSGDLWSLKLLYMNGILTTTYLITCFALITSVWSKNLSKNKKF